MFVLIEFKYKPKETSTPPIKNKKFDPVKFSYSVNEKKRDYIKLIEWIKP